jgi:hypothetical protein
VVLDETVRVCVAVETEDPMVQLNAVRALGVVLNVGAVTVKLTGMLRGEFAAKASVMTMLPV